MIATNTLNPALIALIVVVCAMLVSSVIFVIARYKKCPADKIMVIYGKVGKNPDGTPRSCRCIHGGAALVWPIFQAYSYLDLTPMKIRFSLRNAQSRQKTDVRIEGSLSVAISAEAGVMQNAAERLCGLPQEAIQELAEDIFLGQLRLLVSHMDFEEIDRDRDDFLTLLMTNVETEIRRIGLRVINIRLDEISERKEISDF